MAAYGKERGGPLDADALAALVSWIRSHGPAPIAIPTRGAGDATRGAPVYAARCERCHGSAQARGNAVHLANARFLDVASDPFLGWAIVQGRPGTPMEAWKGTLTEGQIDDVVAYVRAFGKPPVIGSLPAPTGKEPLVINPRGKSPAFTLRADPCATAAPCTPDPRFVSVDQVKQALEEKRKLIIIDARPPSDWMRVHIPGAVSIPYHDMSRLAEVPADGTWVIAYCACPHHLSGEVVDALRKRGVKHAAVLDEGILEWHRRGYPVVAAPGVEPPPSVAKMPPLPSASASARATP
jgi:rhodanese-related sulfurtransferase/mono/diheme cytochrome c family protein